MCRLSLAWVTSENSTMLLESDILRLFFTGPFLSPRLSVLVSGVDCPCPFFHALRGLQPQLPSVLVSGVDCPSVLPRQLLLFASSCPVSTTNSFCLSLGRVVNSHSPPRTTSGYGEISCPRILCLVSRQNRLVCFGGQPP